MLLNIKSISASASAICFFAIAIIGCINDLLPLTCCKRAVIGAVITYTISIFIVRAVNWIILDAMADSQVNKQGNNADAS